MDITVSDSRTLLLETGGDETVSGAMDMTVSDSRMLLLETGGDETVSDSIVIEERVGET
jgi:hypothetical protein